MPAKSSEKSSCEIKSSEKTASFEKLSTAPFDTRFPNQNQTRNCWQNYVDYYRCHKLKGETYAPCEYFKKVFTSMCPKEWVSVWDERRANGTFAGKI